MIEDPDQQQRPNQQVMALVRDAARPGWTIQCDFDGTISLEDVTDSLLQRFGRDGWEALEDDWVQGRIGSRECMKGQIALLDLSEAELTEHLDGMAIDPRFVDFVHAAQRRGIEVQVVSDGLDRAIRHILQRHGLGLLPVYANQLRQAGERRWQLHSPHADAQCVRASGNCKCARAAEQQALARRVLYIGDGSSDFCVTSRRADAVLAKDGLIDHCLAHGIAHHPFTHFGEALELMTAIVTHSGVEAVAS
jgi:2-hydroxy-3-keto-5-methylthiopentenyl-1-phosphate phosphatase